MKIMLIVGARPNFMKAAPIIAAIRERNRRVAGVGQSSGRAASHGEEANLVLVHTGQHYDQAMSESFFTDLRLPKPDVHLGVGSGSHASQTAEIMRRFEEVLMREQPDVVIVVGDVNSTVACALVAAKATFDAEGRRPLVAHVEAGLRSFDRTMPEEINRIVTDHVSDLLFASEQSGADNLLREGVAPLQIHFVGNTMIDSLLASKAMADQSKILQSLGLQRAGGGSGDEIARYALLTLHRPANVDNRNTFLSILEGLEELGDLCPIIFPVHPRTRTRIAEFQLERFLRGIRLVDPLGYLDFLCLMKNARLVVTDSGGIQEETTCLGVPCVTVRENTERPVTLTHGSNVMGGTSGDRIRQAVREQIDAPKKGARPEKWDGLAGTRIVGVLVTAIEEQRAAGACYSQPSVEQASGTNKGSERR
jgi:UDP-N-acetylglucosamine 2-epimerase (non-hydrolysing)